MTFSLWNPISIVSVVNMLPKDSTCHHGHTGSELLNGHRWYYTLCTHADDLIPVRLRYFVLQYANVSTWFTAQSASLCFAFQDVTGAALFFANQFLFTNGYQFLCASAESSRPLRVQAGTRDLLRESKTFCRSLT